MGEDVRMFGLDGVQNAVNVEEDDVEEHFFRVADVSSLMVFGGANGCVSDVTFAKESLYLTGYSTPLAGCAPIWHSEDMEKPIIEETPNKKPPMRCSFPPYYVAAVEGDTVFACLPGENYEMVERSLAPSGAAVRQMLLTLRKYLRWSRPMLAAYMGVSRDVVRRWEDGSRNPNGAARRLIWLLYHLAFHPKKLKSAVDVIFWGQADELRRWNPGVRARPNHLST